MNDNYFKIVKEDWIFKIRNGVRNKFGEKKWKGVGMFLFVVNVIIWV